MAPSVTHLSRQVEPTVFHFIMGVEHIQRTMVMGDDNDGCLLLVSHFDKEFHDLPTPMTIKGRSRLIGQYDAGAIGERPCDGNPLLLTTGQHGREILGPVSDSEIIEEFQRAVGRRATGLAVEFHRNPHIFRG